MDFNDKRFPDQWYLVIIFLIVKHNTGQTGGPSGIDINVIPVWKMGITGKGVVVSIIDDGIEYTHPDLKRNYDRRASFDFEKNKHDSMPDTKEWSDAHGTRCAGEIAAEANNGFCGVGVAFNCRIGGIKLLSGTMNDSYEAEAISFQNNYIDIYSNSWGPKDDGKSFGKPGELSEKALKKAVLHGRYGKGCIYVWATGNGGLMDDDCNCDGYVTSIYTISIGSISDHGLSVYYKESCPSTMAVTFNGGSHREKEENKIITTDINGKCTDHFRGTSSAAPIAAGIIALALEANSDLTWRDVQHLIVHSSSITSPLDIGWKKNGAGISFNHKFGFGKLDAFNMVNLAKSWINVKNQKHCLAFSSIDTIQVDLGSNITLNIPTDGCALHSKNRIEQLEHVILRVSYSAPLRGLVSIGLTSPSGTFSQMLSPRKRDVDDTDIIDWDFMTVFNWDENPSGTWLVEISEHHSKNLSSKNITSVGKKAMDEEDLTKNIMDELNNKDLKEVSKKSDILFLERIKRDENTTPTKLFVSRLELYLYGT